MSIIEECKNCLYTSDHPFGISFDKNGVCSGCNFHIEKEKISWNYRKQEIINLLKNYKSKKGNNDCIIHIDGTAQSYYVLHLVKNILNMNPIVVNYNSQFLTDIGVRNIANLITKFDTNFYQLTSNPNEYKVVVKHALQKMNNLYWPYLAGRSSLGYRLSIKKKIPLVIHGALQSNEQVGMFSHYDDIEYSRWYRMEHELSGVDENNFISASDTIDEKFFEDISFPSDNELIENGTRGIFLSNYFKWDPTIQNEKMLKYSFTPQKICTSFDTFENAGCSVYFGLHDIMRYMNCGYIKAREHLSREIRFKRIDKKKANKLYNLYLTKLNIEDFEIFFDWLRLNKDSQDWFIEYFFDTKRKLVKKRNYNSRSEISSFFSKNAFYPKEYFKLYGKGI